MAEQMIDTVLNPVASATPELSAGADSGTDEQLLHHYAETGDHDTFARIVSRHADWVYSVALRQVRDSGTAEDVAQAVFIILARKARSLGRGTILSGWLFRAVRFVAIDALRSEHRRRMREQSAYREMEVTMQDAEVEWDKVSPVIDGCLAELKKTDQTAILLRFYERKPWRDVGTGLGLSEDAARIRVDRALEKLRLLLTRRGLAGSAATLSSLLAAYTVQAAPAALAQMSAGSAAPLGSCSVNLLARSALRRLLLRKLEIALAVGLILLAAILAEESFRRIPLSQNSPMNVLVGRDAAGALAELDRGFMAGDSAGFLRRVYFRDPVDEALRPILEKYVPVAAEFRRTGRSVYGDFMFGYYATLDTLLVGRQIPLVYEKKGSRATGSFARNRGIFLIQVEEFWQWDFFTGLSATQWSERAAAIARETISLEHLTEKMRSVPPPPKAEILEELRRR